MLFTALYQIKEITWILMELVVLLGVMGYKKKMLNMNTLEVNKLQMMLENFRNLMDTLKSIWNSLKEKVAITEYVELNNVDKSKNKINFN